jgi:hypothetical protein
MIIMPKTWGEEGRMEPVLQKQDEEIKDERCGSSRIERLGLVDAVSSFEVLNLLRLQVVLRV